MSICVTMYQNCFVQPWNNVYALSSVTEMLVIITPRFSFKKNQITKILHLKALKDPPLDA